MDVNDIQNQLSTVGGQAAFLNEKILKPLEEKYGVSFEESGEVARLKETLEDNPTIETLREAFANQPDVSAMFPNIEDEGLQALLDLAKNGSLPDSLQAIMDAVARLQADRAGGVGVHFDEDA